MSSDIEVDIYDEERTAKLSQLLGSIDHLVQ